MKKLIFVVTLLGALVAGGWWMYDRSAAESDTLSDDYVARAEVRDIDFELQISGEIAPVMEVEIKPEVGGRVKKLHVSTGQEVEKGQLLVEIDDSDLLTEKQSALTEIEGARLKAELARRNYERSKGLYESNLISSEIFDNMRSELDIAGNELTKAESELQTVEDKLRKTRITSPADGTILSINVLEGQVVVAAASVNNGTTLMNIADLSRLIVNTHVNQVDIANIEFGQEVVYTSETFPDIRNEASIDFISPVATIVKNVKGFPVEALIDNPDPRLRPGMTVMMTVPVANASDVVSVPISAVFTEDNAKRIVYVRQGTHTERREVKIGITDLFYAEVTSGLKPGEEILLVKPDNISS